MTVGDLLATAWRHRIVTAVCLALTAIALLVGSFPTVSWNGRVSVVLLAPASASTNAIAPTTVSLVATTGIVGRLVNGPHDGPQTVSADLTLTSTGVEQGWSVRQPNAGGQWDVNYEESRLDVKSSGRTLAESSAQMAAALTSIEDALRVLQDSQNVNQRQRIRLELSPRQPEFTVQSGSRVRVLAATGLVGLLLTIGALAAVDRRSASRSSASKPSSTNRAGLEEFADSNS